MTAELVGKALALWPIEVQVTNLAARRENEVYRVTLKDGTSLALRFHRPGYRSDAQLLSELLWMEVLEKGGMRVPRPHTSRSGLLIEHCEGYQVDMLSWLQGVPLGCDAEAIVPANREEVFSALGESLAQLHVISDQWVPPKDFERPKWDCDGLTGDNPLWGRFWENPALSGEERKLLLHARDKAREGLLARSKQLDFGLIHADAVRENVLVDGNSVHLIDFDDGGWGFRLFDIATVLNKNRNEADYPKLELALLSGYRRRKEVDERDLPLFLMLRAFTYLGWVIPRLGEPGFTERNQRNIGPALKLAAQYVS